MTSYIRVLAWLQIILNGGMLAVGTILCAWLGIGPDDREQVAAAYIGMFFLMLVPFLLPGLIGGIGLLRRKSWARIVIIIVSAIWLLEFPIGTALGAFGLWVLLSRRGQEAFAAGTAASAAHSMQPALAAFRRRLSEPVFGVLAAMFLVAAGFVLVLAIGFHLHGETPPGEIDSAVPAAALVVLVSAVAGGIAIWSKWHENLRRQHMGREVMARAAEQRATRIAELSADPVKRKYIPLVERGEYWSDEQIAYHEDRSLTGTCAHLQPIEQAMRIAGIDLRRITSTTVSGKCRINVPEMEPRFSVQPPVYYVETYQGDRGNDDFPTAFFNCRACHTAISVLHPDEARADTRWFPNPPAVASPEASG